MAASGLALSQSRRAALKYLITTDPRRALQSALPVGLRGELPAAIQAQLQDTMTPSEPAQNTNGSGNGQADAA